jgi:Tol biopolymer transport system component
VDISGSGDWITFMSYADLNGLNTGGTYTVYWANRQGTQVQQLLRLETKPDGVSSLFAEVPRMSDDGSRVLFSALAPYSATAPDNGWKMFMHTRL